MDLIWSLSARYCARHDVQALVWLWGLVVVLGAGAVGLRRYGRFGTAGLALAALCTGAVGVAIFYGCISYAPYSMGLGEPAISAARLDTVMCLGNDAFGTALGWTIVVLSCLSVTGLFNVARLRRGNSAIAISSYAGAGVLLIVAAAAAFLLYFNFSWCFSRRLF